MDWKSVVKTWKFYFIYLFFSCVDSGLWKPATDDPGTNPEDGFRKRDNDDDEEENEYAEITPKPAEED